MERSGRLVLGLLVAGLVVIWPLAGASASAPALESLGPKISKLAPNGGPAAGGTSVTITGANFDGVVVVEFGGVPATSVSVNSPTSITAETPPGTSGTANVTVETVAGINFPSGRSRFKYERPTITGLSPANGPVSGGNQVVISGSGFAVGSSDTAVRFGKTPSTSVSCESSSRCTAVAPPGKRHLVYLIASVGKQRSQKNRTTGAFAYIPGPLVKKVSPKLGPAAGGTSVTIVGKDFVNVREVLFGSRPAAYTLHSPTSISAVAPPGSTGAVNVVVVTESGANAPLRKNEFKYERPTITAVSPSSGPLAGGGSVSISGSGFATGTNKTLISFGKNASPDVVCESSTSCTAVVPAGHARTVNLRAVVGKEKSKKTDAGDTYTYQKS